MSQANEVLILGASYGALLGSKLVMAGHNVHLICLPEEAALINQKGVLLRMPIKGRDAPIEIRTQDYPGKLTAGAPDAVDLNRFHLVGLAMQEPQYRVTEIHTLLNRVAEQRVPCMSIMNMPPLPYLKRIPGLDADALRACYTKAAVWDAFDPDSMTLCSPDPQAFRPPDEPTNVIQITLPTNFKAARFKSDAHTDVLRKLEHDIAAITIDVDGGSVTPPVKLKVHDSVFVPMAKWSMLLTGNYRCIQPHNMRSIKDAVHSDIDASERIYQWVGDLCVELGANRADLVPFEKYANAAKGLLKPSSAARALASGAPYIERVDLLVKTIAGQHDLSNDDVDVIVDCVNAHLEKNRES